MPRLADRLGGFAAALLDPSRSAPSGLVGPDGKPSARRFAVYRNNVVVGLTEALRANFPAVCRIVGEEFFLAMAHPYIILEPPASPIAPRLRRRISKFHRSIRARRNRCPTWRTWRAIERAVDGILSRAGRDSFVRRRRSPRWRATGSPRLASQLHPALRIVRSHFPALTIWRMNVDGGVPEPVDLDAGGEDALIMRPEAEVTVRSMPPGGAEFLAALAGGETLTEAAKTAMRAEMHFDLAANLAALIDAGAFAGCTLADH